MKDDLKDFLSFNKAERRGIFVLSTLIILLLLYHVFGPFRSPFSTDYTEFDRQILKYKTAKDSLESIQTAEKEKPFWKNTDSEIENNPAILKKFDPNKCTEKDWLDLGLSQKQANSILKYVAKGGKFYKPEDIRKMYCLSAEESDILMPFVQIEEQYFDENNTYASESETWEEEQFQIELNAASFEDLMRINGVGPATAKAIIKYRELLGGYYSAQQLLDVYHIDSTNYTQISNFLTINPDSIHKININKAGYYDLKKHPYIGKALAYEIEQYRSMKGNFKTVEAVINVKGMNEDLYRKIYIYFAISDD